MYSMYNRQRSRTRRKIFFLFDFFFSNFLLLLEIQGEGSIDRFSFSFVIEWNGTDSHDSCRP